MYCNKENYIIYMSNTIEELFNELKSKLKNGCIIFFELFPIKEYIRPWFDIDGLPIGTDIEIVINYIIELMNAVYNRDVTSNDMLIGSRVKKEEGEDDTMSYRIIIFNLKVYSNNFYTDMDKYQKEKVYLTKILFFTIKLKSYR